MFTKIGCKDSDFFDTSRLFRRFSAAKRFIFIFYGDFMRFFCPFYENFVYLRYIRKLTGNENRTANPARREGHAPDVEPARGYR